MIYQALEENVKALDVKLTPEEISHVRELVTQVDLVSGSARYPPGRWESLYAETPAWNPK